MSSQNWLFVLAYLLVYLALLSATVRLWRWRRKTKWPFKESDRLLRGPGEGLKRKIAALDERLLLGMLGGIVVALSCAPVLLWAVQRSGLSGIAAIAAFGLGIFVLSLAHALWTFSLIRERSNHLLGWFGERMTAEKLRPLEAQGYQIYHDVPGEPGKNGFNLDHVVVGPTGVTVVETKTRRKGRARPGRKDHEVIFDGVQLDWPWDTDRHGVQQALNEADWLAKWIAQGTGLRVPVQAVLSLPGWYVREAPSSKLRVVNPSFLPSAIRGRGEAKLTAEQIDLIARQLDLRCRDVEE